MTCTRTLLASLLLAACTTPALAVPPAGSGGGYYGGADFVGNHGITVGPYTNYWDCNAALQSNLTYHTTTHGSVIETIYPCDYAPPFGFAQADDPVFVLDTGSPDGSLDDATGVLADIVRLRGRYNIDRYEAELGALYKRTR